MGGQLLSAAWTAGITVIVIFVAIVGVGFWMLARRRGNGRVGDPLDSLQQRANILLVRVDDAVKNAEDELGFAIAQFGDVKSQEFDRVLSTAKKQLREAFELQQKLDDAYADSDTQRRDWSGRIIHLCETAAASLEQQEKSFAELRELEKNAPQNLAAVRSALSTVDSRLKDSAKTLAALSSGYSADAVSTVADSVERAQAERAESETAAAKADAILTAAPGDRGTPDTGASDLIRRASEHAYRAQKLLEGIEALRTELAKARDAVVALRNSTRESLAPARAARDAPPDADTGAAVGRAIATVEAALAVDPDLKDPLATLETLRAANAELDTSMAGARNQQQRLDGARTALVGALVGARSQLTATRNYIDTRRGGVGADARTRLAEAERLLAVAEAEADPVAALDTARSSATYSRDADALARYDLMGR
ncbi:DNA repair exonuclease SbcCD ATPase subunit [Cryobacterium mesophilum]|uniref:Uncharacterized protein n=1 Tax=Terrimesophilobacter mesophilus TaxID=433647 RepID=A0A4R8VDT8_9MICO|nr:hypothetical protein [Terrimesophilobacter mesophilus]MBB5633615.1 DNA repair exonuclease SbcCD ATPase subunit [Terrimesophilobacter mesophilus]TFB80312.1 hypothetical protein E3N84_09885 [Terrimesophilobacter mesophilus]